ncbi:MAG: TonB-dependent receptor domain-containing protein, partial [Hydrogenobaculum sp.]
WRILEKLSFIYGLRFDYIDQFVRTDQLSPRASLVYHYSKSTAFHISYGRFFTPAPMLLVTKTNASVLQGTTADSIAASGLSPDQIGYFVLPQRSSYYDVGLSHKFPDSTSLMLDAYFEEIHDVLDDGQFGNARVLTPFNYKHGKEYGINLNLSKMKKRYGAYLNFSYSVARAEDAIDQQYNFT